MQELLIIEPKHVIQFFLITQQPASMNQQEYAVQRLTSVAERCSNVTLATDAVMRTLKAHKQTQKKHTNRCTNHTNTNRRFNVTQNFLPGQTWIKTAQSMAPEGSLHSSPS